MTSDGKLHPCSDKSKLTHALERLGDFQNMIEDAYLKQVTHKDSCIIFDGMAVVQEMVVHKGNIKSYKSLLDFALHSVEYK